MSGIQDAPDSAANDVMRMFQNLPGGSFKQPPSCAFHSATANTREGRTTTAWPAMLGSNITKLTTHSCTTMQANTKCDNMCLHVPKKKDNHAAAPPGMCSNSAACMPSCSQWGRQDPQMPLSGTEPPPHGFREQTDKVRRCAMLMTRHFKQNEARTTFGPLAEVMTNAKPLEAGLLRHVQFLPCM